VIQGDLVGWIIDDPLLGGLAPAALIVEQPSPSRVRRSEIGRILTSE